MVRLRRKMHVTSPRTVVSALTSAYEPYMLENHYLLTPVWHACSDASVPGTYRYHHSHQVLHTRTTQIVGTLQAMYTSAVLHRSIGRTILQKVLC